MIHTKIITKTKDDTEPAFPEITKVNFHGEGELYGVVILDGGTSRGKTSIGIVIQLEDGKFVMAQISAAMLDAIWHGLQGAEQRFADLKSNKQ